MKKPIGIAFLLLAALSFQGVTTAGERTRPQLEGKVLLRNPRVRNARQIGSYAPLRTFGRSLHQDRTSGVRSAGPQAAGGATPLVFQGLKSKSSLTPSDVNGDVGPNHYVQGINSGSGTTIGVFNKSGTLLQRMGLQSLWKRGPCRNQAQGDPVIQYDAMAGRWLLTQFAFTDTERGPLPPFYECIALSNTSDPLGPGKTYTFLVDGTWFPDFPKFGVWSDGYYMTVHLFDKDFDFKGQGVIAFDRASMLAGTKPRGSYRDKVPAQYFYNPSHYGALPADVVGTTPPPPGAPNYMVIAKDDDLFATTTEDRIDLMTFTVDWDNSDNSKVRRVAKLPTAPFKSVLCRGWGACIPQPDSAMELDPLAGFKETGNLLMYPLSYRNFGTSESLVFNHTVNVGDNRAGIRWYELVDPGGTPSVRQQSTFAPSSQNRWNGSISMDGDGNIGLAYSVSGRSQYPSVRYTSHLSGDPLDSMRAERSIVEGGGSQLGSNRWGDYTSTQIDPDDDCTFWHTNQYYKQSRYYNWDTIIGAFKLPSCP
ncbi:MAG: hypothetical protein M3198_09300 [Actinomycetota bacterium]|nr:hypothetical protein [Actinomycetota bacterium]